MPSEQKNAFKYKNYDIVASLNPRANKASSYDERELEQNKSTRTESNPWKKHSFITWICKIFIYKNLKGIV